MSYRWMLRAPSWTCAVPLAVLAGACGGRGAGHARSAAETVRVEAVSPPGAPVGVPVAGSVEPIRRASPASKLMGTVVSAPFEEGDRVAAGQILVRIDDRDMAARRTQVEARITEAEVLLGDAETNVARMDTLAKQGAIAGVQLEQARTGRARAAAGVETARAALRELEATAAYGTITAPFAGEIVRKAVQAGDIATPGVPLFVLEDLSRLRVIASIGEGTAARLRPGARVRVQFDAAGVTAVGVVEAVLPASRPPVSGFHVNVVLDRPSPAVQSGMTATVFVPADDGEAVQGGFRVPQEALVRRGQLVGVFVVDADVARLRWIRTGAESGRQVEVLSGLRGGERVVVGAARDRLTDGERVVVTAGAR